MREIRKRRDKRGFTGLEAAIVLTAFIVVAAVFSYMVLGAGFFSTEKAKAVVHTGVEQATSSVELAGDVIGESEGSDYLKRVTLYLQLTAGENPVDMDKLTIAYADEYVYNGSLVHTTTSPPTVAGTWNYTWVTDKSGTTLGDGDNMLETKEKVKVVIQFPSDAGGGTGGVAANGWFQIEVKPEQGGTLPVKKTVPGAIDEIMILH